MFGLSPFKIKNVLPTLQKGEISNITYPRKWFSSIKCSKKLSEKNQEMPQNLKEVAFCLSSPAMRYTYVLSQTQNMCTSIQKGAGLQISFNALFDIMVTDILFDDLNIYGGPEHHNARTCVLDLHNAFRECWQ